MTELKLPSKAYPKDPLRVEPKVKQQISPKGIWVYTDTCCQCGNYSECYHACKIRDSAKPDVITNAAKTMLSVPCGYKCKHWRQA